METNIQCTLVIMMTDTVHSRYYDDGYIDSTSYYDTFFNTVPIQSRCQKLSYIDSPVISIHFQSPLHIVISRVYCIWIVLLIKINFSKLSYIDNPYIMICFKSTSHIVIMRVYCI